MKFPDHFFRCRQLIELTYDLSLSRGDYLFCWEARTPSFGEQGVSRLVIRMSFPQIGEYCLGVTERVPSRVRDGTVLGMLLRKKL
jgi:hypothetical protein